MNTIGEYILGKGVLMAAADFAADSGSASAEKEFIGSFYSRFFSIVGFVGLMLQLFAVSRLIKFLGVRIAILILPCVAMGSYTLIGLMPFLAVMQWAKTAENSLDYSLNNTIRHILFLPTTREQKYKAKVAIDSFFVRFGDVLSAGVVFAGVTWLSFGITQFAIFNLVMAVVCVALALLIGKEYKLRTAEMAETEKG
jgi:AAA family ATP:ADP antiporter